jgi:hypothetical protein
LLLVSFSLTRYSDKNLSNKFKQPKATHYWHHLKKAKNNKFDDVQQELPIFFEEEKQCLGAREALGLSDIGFDALAPTLRSALTGPRHTTSVLSSTSVQKLWAKLEIWPNGVGLTREKAASFPTENGLFRLSVPDCAISNLYPDNDTELDTSVWIHTWTATILWGNPAIARPALDYFGCLAIFLLERSGMNVSVTIKLCKPKKHRNNGGIQ